MDAEKVWDSVKDNLQHRVKRAVYDTWVRDTVGIGLSEDLLKVEVGNSYARDFLQGEVLQNALAELKKILDRKIEIQLVVQSEAEPDQDRVETPEIACSNTEDQIHLQARYLNDYDEIVRPERVIVIPRYYVRWIPWLGVDLAWLPIGFRQAAFLNGCRYEAGETFEATASEIARWSGMSRAKFWRRINDPILRWFIQPQEGESKKWKIGADQRPHQAPRRWRVALSMPLTPADAGSLRNWLYERMEEGADPVAVIKHALDTPLEELIPWPKENVPQEIATEPSSVQEIVLSVLGSSIEPSMERMIVELADALANHITDPKRVILVSHYFVERWLPLLRPGPGWFITLLRSRCYYNPKSGELRDEIWVHGGYPELAKKLGIRRPATIAEWLRGRNTKRKNAGGKGLLSSFVSEIERKKGSNQAVSLCFRVEMHDTLTPSDQVAYEVSSDSRWDGKGSRGDIANETHKREGRSVNETHRVGGRNASETLRMVGRNANEILRAGGDDADETVLKDSFNTELFKDKDYIISTTTTAATSRNIGGLSNGEKVVVCLSWELETLLSHSRVDKGVARRIVELNASTEAYISWLLYGASPRGASIENPVSHALSRLRESPSAGAGGAFDRLAALPPAETANLVLKQLQGTGKWTGNKHWGRAMGDADPNRMMDLADQLGLDLGEGGYE